jgi:DNA polymerase (family 10)
LSTHQQRVDLVAALEEMTTLLELDGANQFKSGAYSRAARALGDWTGDLGEAVAQGTLTNIEGVGKGLAEKITEFVNTGAIAELAELRERIPASLAELTEIPGFGAKKARQLWQDRGITTLEQLEELCRSGELAKVKGFGEKTVQNILGGIARNREYQGRFRLDTADNAIIGILEAMRGVPGVERMERAGSLRRRMDTVKDIDVLIASRDSGPVMDAFVALPQVASVIAKGPTKSSVILSGGMQADLRVVTPEQFPFAWHHFTGSKEHNTAMRRRAKERGLRMNEYGIFPEDSETSLVATSEEEVFALLELDWIAPEMRENMGEIEAAAEHKLPALISREAIRGIPHMHTHYSDGTPKLEEYARWADEFGIAWMGISDHSQTAGYAGGLKPDRVAEQRERIDEINAVYRHKGVRLLAGIESDILADGSLDYEEDVLAKFDFIVASVHSGFSLSEDEQTARLIRAVENKYTTILGHATGRLLLKREGIKCDLKAVIRAAAAAGTAIEINANPLRLDLDWRLVHYALDEGCRISLGPDAHQMSGLAHLDYGIAIGRKGWLTPNRCINCMETDAFLELARRKTPAGKKS